MTVHKSVHQTRSNYGRVDGICIFLHRVRLDLCVSNDDIEAFCIEIINKNSKNIFINAWYRHSSDKGKVFEENLTTFRTTKNLNKSKCVVGDLNLNLVDCDVNAKVKMLLFQNNYIPVIENFQNKCNIYRSINANSVLGAFHIK